MPDQFINAFSGNSASPFDPNAAFGGKQWLQTGGLQYSGGMDSQSTGDAPQQYSVDNGDSTHSAYDMSGGLTNTSGYGNQSTLGFLGNAMSDPAKFAAMAAAAYTGVGLAGGAGAGGLMSGYGGGAATAADVTTTSAPSSGGWLSSLFGDSSAAPAATGVDASAGMSADQYAAFAANGGQAPSGLSSLFSGTGLSTNLLSGVGGKLTVAQGLSSLYDMYAKNKTASAQQAAYDKLQGSVNGMYAAGSPEMNLLQQTMNRQDAASGRNSQYGVRATDIAAKVAQAKLNALTQIAPGQNALLNQSLGNQTGGLNSLFGYMNQNATKDSLASLPGFGGTTSGDGSQPQYSLAQLKQLLGM